MIFFKKSFLYAVATACFVGSLPAETNSLPAEISVEQLTNEQLKAQLLAAIKLASAARASDRCMSFDSRGLYPQAIICDAVKSEVKDILFACDTNGVDFVSNPEDFEHLIPAKLKTSYPQAEIFMEYKYKGFSADKMVMKAISSNDYEAQFKKPFMVAEYEQGMSMRWTFEKVEQLEGFVKYLQKNIKFFVTQKKPFLVLEVEKGLENLKDETANFLNKNFNVADLSKPENAKRADEIDAKIKQAYQDASDYAKIQVGKGSHDMLLEEIDKDFSGFESKKLKKTLIMWTLKALLIGIPLYVVYLYLDAYGIGPSKLWLQKNLPWLEAQLKKTAKAKKDYDAQLVA